MISKLFKLIIHVIQMGDKLKEIPELFIPAVNLLGSICPHLFSTGVVPLMMRNQSCFPAL